MAAGQEIESVEHNGTLLAIIVRAELKPLRTMFLTTNDLPQQLGLVVYPQGGEVARHYHRPIERQIVGTSEVILVRSGRCLLDLYDRDLELAQTRELGAGDVVLLVAGGHGFRMLEDTVLLEVKQGPYLGLDEKERF
jgi:quercetin dioxygenase-like cupin family protein